jgi:hypothetical protein
VVFEVPAAGEGAALLDGSSPQASIEGDRVIVAGPFAPGMTLVQFAYSLPFGGDRLMVQQKLPVPLTALTVLAQKVGQMHLASPQMARHRDMTAEGQVYIVGQGPALNAGDAVTFEFTGLPHRTTWPRNLALALAVAILAAGAWGGMRAGRVGRAHDGRRRKLEARRDELFSELVTLEEQHNSGAADAHGYSSRRRELITALERVYAEMDEEAAA